MPTPEDLAHARALVAEQLDPTEVADLVIDGGVSSLKLECAQPTGSFKVRGALAALGQLVAEGSSSRVVTCSAGNHGLGVAWAARQLDIAATVVVPATASPVKVAKLEELPVELLLVGQNYDEAEAAALELAASDEATFVSPYNDSKVVAGQATVLTELLEQRPSMTRVIVPVGGGGLLAGTLLAAPEGLEVVGASVARNQAFASLLSGVDLADLELHPTVADGLAGGIEPDSMTLEVARLCAASLELVTVEEDEILRAMAAAWRSGLVIEGSAAVALAVALREGPRDDTVVVVTGSNVTGEVLERALAAR